MEVQIINYSGISTCHSIAKELLTKPDDFLTVTVGNNEYAIKGIKVIKTHANYDDSVTHITILCDDNFIKGNILR